MLNNENACSQRIRHPELVSGSHEILNRAALVQNDIRSQCGRSMVEMLGVLAIIGVLSVAGIAGYSMAMKRYRANEVVNTASVLYTLAEANYLTSGVTSHSLASAGLSKPSGIDDMTYDIDTKNITIEGADDLCDIITGIVGNTAEYEISCS